MTVFLEQPSVSVNSVRLIHQSSVNTGGQPGVVCTQLRHFSVGRGWQSFFWASTIPLFGLHFIQNNLAQLAGIFVFLLFTEAIVREENNPALMPKKIIIFCTVLPFCHFYGCWPFDIFDVLTFLFNFIFLTDFTV